MPAKVVASISLPAEILKRAGKVAKKEHMSRSELIKEAIKAFLDEHEWSRMRDEALPFAQARGIRSEEDVENLIRELRHGGGER